MKRNNRIISLVVTLAIILSSMIIIVPTAAEEAAADAVPAWTYAEASETLQGSGTAEDPYLIGSVADFLKFANDVTAQNAAASLAEAAEGYAPLPENACYKLTADIDFSEKNWNLVPTVHKNVDFNGNGKTITVDFKETAATMQGLFGDVKGGKIHDFDFKATWKNQNAAVSNYQATLASRSYGGQFENINAELDVEIFYPSGVNAQVVAGLVAYVTWSGTAEEDTIFTNVKITGAVSFTTGVGSNTALCAGVFTGRITSAVFTDCVVDADFTFNRTSGASTVMRCGAYTGYVQMSDAAQKANFINCINNGHISSVDSANAGRSGSWIGQSRFGGSSIGMVSFEGCIDTTTWSHSQGKSHSVIGYADNSNSDNFTVTDMFVAYGVFSSEGAATAVPTATNVFDGFDPVYVDEGDTVIVYINNTLWEDIASERYPVYIAVGFNADDSITDVEVNEELNIATITLEKPDAEAVPQIYYYSTATGDLVSAVDVEKAEQFFWTQFAASEFDNGPLVAGVDVEIATASQLALLANMSNTGTNFKDCVIKLTADIDLGGYQWAQIWANHSGGFAGKIDGQGFSIKNMTLTADSYTYNAAFIGRTAAGFELKNVKFVDPVVAPGDINGSINAAVVAVGSFYGGTIDNVEITGMKLTVPTMKKANGAYVGALVGYLGDSYAVLKNSTASGDIIGTVASTEDNYINHARVGGLVGRTRYGRIENCTSNVNIDITTNLGWKTADIKDDAGTKIGTAYTTAMVSVGGIACCTESNNARELTSIVNCVNNGNIKVTIADDATYARIGGIVAYSNKASDIVYIADSANNGTIEVTRTNATPSSPATGDFDTVAELPADIIGGVFGLSETVTIIENTTSVVYADTLLAKATNGTAMVDGFKAMDGARVRVDATNGLANSGLRFDAKVNKAIVDKLSSNIKMGMMIVPVDMIGEKTAADLYADESILKVEKTADFYNVDSNGNAYYSAAIINLKTTNYDRDFVAIPYMEITCYKTASGANNQLVIFDEYDAADEATRVRSAAEVAALALADTEAGYSDAVKAVLNQYIPAT